MTRTVGPTVMPATITISIPPTINLGPISLAWHGLMIAVGVMVGTMLAARTAERRGLERDRVFTAVVALVLAGVVGSRLYYLVQTQPGALLRPGDWFASKGFAFYGAILAGVPAAWLALRRSGRGVEYLDALAAGFPLGMAVGRIGDLILGEHYGAPTDAPWGFAYTNPGADVPKLGVGYQSGAFYEIVVALVIFAIVWPARGRFKRPGTLLATVVALYSAGRFLLFFAVRDTNVVAFGLRQAQWTSLALLAVALCGLWWARSSPSPARRAATG